MKQVIKILYTLLFFSLTPTIHAAFAASKQKAQSASQLEMPSAHTNNDLLATILENSKILVQQIQNNNRDASERKKALAEVVNAETKLSKNSTTPLAKDMCSAVKTQTTIITQESKAFSAHRKPLEKYNSTKAEQALMDLATEIKKATENSAESFVTETHQALERAIIETERITKEANTAILKASAQVGDGTLTPAQAAIIIGKQNHIIATAQQNLAKAKEQGQKNVAQNDMQASYLSQFATQAYNLGASALAPLKSGYDYTDQEKDIARAIIAELEKQMQLIHADWQNQLKQPGLTEQLTYALPDKYTAAMQELKNEIYQQQLITGDAMSLNRKLFWGTVAVAGAVGAAYLGHQYFAEKASELANETLEAQIQRQNTLSWEDAGQTVQEITPNMPEPATTIQPAALTVDTVFPNRPTRFFDKPTDTENTTDNTVVTEEILTPETMQQPVEEEIFVQTKPIADQQQEQLEEATDENAQRLADQVADLKEKADGYFELIERQKQEEAAAEAQQKPTVRDRAKKQKETEQQLEQKETTTAEQPAENDTGAPTGEI